MTKSRKADLILVLITFLWGGTFPVIRNALASGDVDANTFVIARFILALIVFFPFVVSRFAYTNKKVILVGMGMGFINGISYYTQTLGLHYISSAESAFITSSSVAMIPFLLPLFKLGKPHLFEWIAVAGCLYGIYLLTGANFSNLSFGIWITFIAALGQSISVIFLQKNGADISEIRLLTFYQVCFAFIIPSLFGIHHGFHIHFTKPVIEGLLYCALLSTCLTLFLQARYQRDTTATKAGIIFTMEPVFATLFATLFNHEILTRSIILGGGVILLSLFISEFKKVEN